MLLYIYVSNLCELPMVTVYCLPVHRMYKCDTHIDLYETNFSDLYQFHDDKKIHTHTFSIGEVNQFDFLFSFRFKDFFLVL